MHRRQSRRSAERGRSLGIIAALVASAALALSAAAAGATGAAANAAPRSGTTGEGAEPVAGGSLTYLNMVDTRGFDPAISNSSGASNGMMSYAVFDVLAHELPSTGEVVLGLLDSGESSDALTWTLRLRPDVRFSDGTPLDAEAVKFNWERLADPATGALSMQAAQTIESIDVVDEVTLDVVLTEPNGQFLRTIATTALAWIGSPTALQADPEGFNMKPVGAGPYLLREAVPASEYVFERNPDYYGTTYVDQFTVKIISDEAQRLAALQAGDGDIAITGSGITATQATDAGFDSLTSSPNGGYVVFFNTQQAPFDDLRVREAFALAMNGQEMADTLYSGNRLAADNVFQETSPFYDARFDQAEPDAAAAQQLFDEIAADLGGPIEVTLSHIGVLAPESEWFQAKLAGFDNVTVELELVAAEDYQAKWSQGEVQFGIHAYWFTDPSDLAKFVGTNGPLNFSQTDDPEIVAALSAGAASLDEEERIEIYSSVQQKIVDELPFIVFARQQAWDFFDVDRVHGMGPESRVSAGGILKITEIWVTD